MPTSARAVRVIFGVTVLWITFLQYVLLAVAREEPYPALILPGFPAVCPNCLLESGTPSNKNPELTVRFTDGESLVMPIKSIMPAGPSVSLMAFTAGFGDESVLANPEAVAWLQSRVLQMFPDRPVEGVDLAWRTAGYLAADDAAVEYEPLYTIDIDFESAK